MYFIFIKIIFVSRHYYIKLSIGIGGSHRLALETCIDDQVS